MQLISTAFKLLKGKHSTQKSTSTTFKMISTLSYGSGTTLPTTGTFWLHQNHQITRMKAFSKSSEQAVTPLISRTTLILTTAIHHLNTPWKLTIKAGYRQLQYQTTHSSRINGISSILARELVPTMSTSMRRKHGDYAALARIQQWLLSMGEST